MSRGGVGKPDVADFFSRQSRHLVFLRVSILLIFPHSPDNRNLAQNKKSRHLSNGLFFSVADQTPIPMRKRKMKLQKNQHFSMRFHLRLKSERMIAPFSFCETKKFSDSHENFYEESKWLSTNSNFLGFLSKMSNRPPVPLPHDRRPFLSPIHPDSENKNLKLSSSSNFTC